FAGIVGIGTTTPSAKLDIFNTVSSATAPLFSVASSTNGTGTSTAFIITANEQVGIATSSPWRTFSVSGTVAMNGLTTAVGTPSSVCMNTATKEITVNAATSCVVSDRDQKQQIQDLTVSGLDAIRNIKPVTFAYNDYPGRSRIGFIAQDLQAVDNRLGDAFDKDGIARSIDIPAIMSITVKAVKELDTKVDTQASTTANQFLSLIGAKPTSADNFLVNGDLTFKNNFTIKGDNMDYLYIKSNTGDAVLTFDKNGNIGVGTTTPAYKMQIAGDVAATAFVNVSTREAKKDITYLNDDAKFDALSDLAKIKIAKYRYKADSETDPLRLGLIAEEAPVSVLSASGKGVDIYKLATFTLAAVQAQQKNIEAIDTRLAALEAKVASSTPVVSEGLVASVIAAIKDLTLTKLEIGSQEKPSGITLYDEETNEPYCIKMSGGKMKSTSGACGTVVEEVKPEPKLTTPDPVISTPTPTETASSTATTTTPAAPAPESVEQASSTPSTSSGSNSSTPAPEPAPTPVENTPAPEPAPAPETPKAEEPKTEAPKAEEPAPSPEPAPAPAPAETASTPSVDSTN
ncbi:MAG: tail fiber domain-containing protein, partial [Candidatus Pacebacteria bacterium]|nr:tail fiber domain-containing protein [Candidatus Paceibacterota bacterium]